MNERGDTSSDLYPSDLGGPLRGIKTPASKVKNIDNKQSNKRNNQNSKSKRQGYNMK